MKNKIIRIKDIALKAQVSTGTVDRVLHKRGRVAEDVEQRVLKIIKELNYEPNLMARTLGLNKQCRIAALMPDYREDDYWKVPKTGIEKAAKDLKQYGVIVEQFLFNPYDVKSFIKKAEALSATAPDGILLSPIFYRESLLFFERWKAAKIPFVLFNTQITEYDPLSYIGQDSYQSGMLAANLIHLGQVAPCAILVAHIDEEISNAAHLLKKEQGFRNYFLKNGLDGQYEILKVELKRADAIDFVKKLDEILHNTRNLKWLFVTTSRAYDLAAYLEKKQIWHIKIIGYDLLPKNIYYLHNGMISFLINQNPKGQGYWGIYQLVNHLVFKKKVPAIKYLPLDIVTSENLHYFIDGEEIYPNI